MRAAFSFLCVATLAAATSMASAESIDLGRGPVSLVIPSDYDKAEPAPLIVMIHGYTSSGEGQDSYWKIGAQADAYGFFFLKPDGLKRLCGLHSAFAQGVGLVGFNNWSRGGNAS